MAFGLAACGKSDEKKPASQVAVKVNSGEVSVHQIGYVLQRTPNIKPEQADAAKKQILESLIDQELLVQQAVENKVDRNPNVLQAIEVAKREILARAYLEQQVTPKQKPSAQQVKDYYAGHPELFSARKVYRLEEVAFAGTPEALSIAKETLGAGKPVVELVAALKKQNIEAAGGVAVKPAEQIALELLPKLAQQKEGQPQLYEGNGKASVVTVLATKSEPVTEAQATPIIEQFLANKEKSERSRELLKGLRDKAKLEYVGEYAALAKGESAKPATPAQPTPAATNKADEGINKGIAGLK
jgi:EpsD family peptidyl-prolyl cis-trans isomerase